MSSFFTLPRKRKRQDAAPGSTPAKKRGAASKSLSEATDRKQKRPERDESISGSESEDVEETGLPEGSGDEGSITSAEDDTAADRRLRLAEQYLDNVRGEVEDVVGFDAADIDRDLIAERLKEDAVCYFASCILIEVVFHR
jgi:ribosomal RNA-processing protein 9